MFCILLAMSRVRAEVEPPAPQVMSQKAGWWTTMRSIRSNRLSIPSSVLGGKNSKEKTTPLFANPLLILSITFMLPCLLPCCCYCCCTSSSSSFPVLLLSDFCHELQRHSVRKTTIPEELKQRPPKSLLAPIGQDSNPSSSREHNASEIRTSTSKAQTHIETHKKITITKPRKKDRGRKKRTRSEIGPRKTQRERATTTTSASLPLMRVRLF